MVSRAMFSGRPGERIAGLQSRTTNRGEEPTMDTMKVEQRVSSTTGEPLYKITKPGFYKDMFLTREHVTQLINELDKLGLIER